MSRKKIIAANWKMYKTPEQSRQFMDEFVTLVATHTRDEIVICPPFVDIAAVVERTIMAERDSRFPSMHDVVEGLGRRRGEPRRSGSTNELLDALGDVATPGGRTPEAAFAPTVAAR